tara:strand:+ start:373 stop:615 length:243 start_codon:yes stop_codon:yes gene_type:complete
MSRFPNRKYVILTASEAEDIDYSSVMQRSAENLRWNADETKTIVKYEGTKPRFLYGKDTLSHAGILSELEKEEWNPALEE